MTSNNGVAKHFTSIRLNWVDRTLRHHQNLLTRTWTGLSKLRNDAIILVYWNTWIPMWKHELKKHGRVQPEQGVVTCTCNPATLVAVFRNGVSSIPFGVNSSSIGGWVLWPPVIQHYDRTLTKYWDLTEI